MNPGLCAGADAGAVGGGCGAGVGAEFFQLGQESGLGGVDAGQLGAALLGINGEQAGGQAGRRRCQHGDRRRHRIPGPMKRHQEGVPLGVDFLPVSLGERVTEEALVFR